MTQVSLSGESAKMYAGTRGRHMTIQTIHTIHVPRLGASGSNFARVWICMWNRGMPLEWVSRDWGGTMKPRDKNRHHSISSRTERDIFNADAGWDAALASLPDYWGGGNYCLIIRTIPPMAGPAKMRRRFSRIPQRKNFTRNGFAILLPVGI